MYMYINNNVNMDIIIIVTDGVMYYKSIGIKLKHRLYAQYYIYRHTLMVSESTPKETERTQKWNQKRTPWRGISE